MVRRLCSLPRAKSPPADRSKVVDGKVKLPGRQNVDVVLTPEKPGSYEIHCSHFLHAAMGMKGQITVE